MINHIISYHIISYHIISKRRDRWILYEKRSGKINWNLSRKKAKNNIFEQTLKRSIEKHTGNMVCSPMANCYLEPHCLWGSHKLHVLTTKKCLRSVARGTHKSDAINTNIIISLLDSNLRRTHDSLCVCRSPRPKSAGSTDRQNEKKSWQVERKWEWEVREFDEVQGGETAWCSAQQSRTEQILENECPLTRKVGGPLVPTESPSSTTRTEYIGTEVRK